MVAEANVLALKETEFSAPVRHILTQLCELFLIYWITENNGDFVLVCLRVSNHPLDDNLFFLSY